MKLQMGFYINKLCMKQIKNGVCDMTYIQIHVYLVPGNKYSL